ncbi:MAG: hypothetical protein HY473_01405 [Candidatus Sungbacteria bacterium]|uniref:Uncharacterized protein n=1 Tax=Candidatus Sungiibacteriota bacterium TaxID=2750080 RepID=A0A932YYS1_9BACT|nr:hypothetical protein [Candidatus Sungbacteria bacterium]
MVGVAAGVDGAQGLLDLLGIGVILSIPISIVAWLTFYLWFKMKGVSFGGAKLGRSGSSSLVRNPLFIIAAALGIEMVPFVNALPAWTAAIITALLVA